MIKEEKAKKDAEEYLKIENDKKETERITKELMLKREEDRINKLVEERINEKMRTMKTTKKQKKVLSDEEKLQKTIDQKLRLKKASEKVKQLELQEEERTKEYNKQHYKQKIKTVPVDDELSTMLKQPYVPFKNKFIKN